jgi:hypothetical protein
MPTSLAALAQPADDELGALGTEAPAASGSEGPRRIDAHVQVLHCPAGSANDVVVQLGPGIPQGAWAAGGDPTRDAQLLEQLQGGVDGRQRSVRELRLDAGKHLLCGRVPSEIGERAVDEDPLRRDAIAAFPEALFEFPISH